MSSGDSGLSPVAPAHLPERELATLRADLCLQARRALGDDDLAQDVAQESLARTLTAVAQGAIRDVTHVASFARGVARHLIADAYRARQRVAAGASYPTVELISLERSGALEEMVGEEDRARVRAALEEMPENDRVLLVLLYVEGLRPDEVARRLKEPAERIRKRKERALKRLRALFDRPAR